MSTFLIESYLSRLSETTVAAEAQRLVAAAEAVAASGAVRHVRSFYVPEDEVCFHVLEASSAAELRRVAGAAAIRVDRISRVVEGQPPPPRIGPPG